MVCWGASVVVSAVSACLCVLLVLVSMSAYSLQSESPLTSKTKFSGHRTRPSPPHPPSGSWSGAVGRPGWASGFRGQRGASEAWRCRLPCELILASSAMASPADARGLAPPHDSRRRPIGPAHLIFDDTIITTHHTQHTTS
eukprot:scaffold24529_cov140-Isochrysis_galbana.AAC.13